MENYLKGFRKMIKIPSHYNYLTKIFSFDNQVAEKISDEKSLIQPPKTLHNNSFNNSSFKIEIKLII